ncbi:MAG: PAS domain-containing sensor histidine kinase [Myxococcota bacterium]|nr:PAS domain-containing sensor histidine kinase [Myxococcota bacterium]
MELPLDQYRVLVEAAPTMIWRAGLDAKCDYFNETWLSFTGRSLAQEVGDGWAEGVHPDDLQRCVDHYLANFEGRRAFEMEYRLRRHDGAYRWIFDRGAPFFHPSGDFAGFIGHCVDVHERRTADDAKTTFLAMLAHELRTPLQSLVLYTAGAKRAAEAGTPIEIATAEKLERQVGRLRRLVAHASAGIDVSLEGPTHVELADADLVAIATSALEVRSDTSHRAIALQLEVKGTPRAVRADPERIAQALDILLDNAVKYSPEGGSVVLVVRFEPEQVVLTALDEGPGISEADLPRIGTPFFRGANAMPRAHPGLGLGLAIARRIAVAHGGRLTLARRPGAGTSAALILPTEVRS